MIWISLLQSRSQTFDSQELISIPYQNDLLGVFVDEFEQHMVNQGVLINDEDGVTQMVRLSHHLQLAIFYNQTQTRMDSSYLTGIDGLLERVSSTVGCGCDCQRTMEILGSEYLGILPVFLQKVITHVVDEGTFPCTWTARQNEVFIIR